MMAGAFIPRDNSHVRIELIDSQTRRLIKAWTFAPQAEIKLGRATESDVELADPYVSRHHASLSLRDNAWFLVSYGRNGVLVAGQRVPEHPATDGLEFRLGDQGPEFRLAIVARPLPTGDDCVMDTQSTSIFLEPVQLSELESPEFQLDIDQQRLSREVGEIEQTDYFQKLQRLSKQLRQQRKLSEP